MNQGSEGVRVLGLEDVGVDISSHSCPPSPSPAAAAAAAGRLLMWGYTRLLVLCACCCCCCCCCRRRRCRRRRARCLVTNVSAFLRTYETHALKEAVGDLLLLLPRSLQRRAPGPLARQPRGGACAPRDAFLPAPPAPALTAAALRAPDTPLPRAASAPAAAACR